jgi:8-oxo-dGTP pyrophosphatase MutT (NUDIX family)
MIDELRLKLTMPLPGQEAHARMVPTGRTLLNEPPPGARVGAVMILLFDIDRKWNTLLIRRTDDGKAHGGQISFPGGAMENRDQNITQTALRECEEETGVRARDIEVLGQLSSLYIHPSNFWVTPVLGYVPNLQHYKAAEKEVQEIIQTPLELLFNPSIKTRRTVISSFPDRPPMDMPVYALADDLLVWGATAMMLSELEHLIVPQG